ncbi:hypothetical protein KCN56_09010 [Photobacterium galatheae]|uniref:hypothetical protein n=1 Tax=Photobacterium galatheae TaxID=1654360 RepID=UPI00202CDA68|nr:hypothetical protein [Photobacterium galatheae]MCM0148697.1 hypothetical protein [Photobacterium galatheae]
MPYQFFYTDYCEDKQIPATQPIDAELSQILHSMDCVLHVEGNFCGIVNPQGQTIQFMVKKNHSILVDVPLMYRNIFIGSKQKHSSLKQCLHLVSEFRGDEDFTEVIQSEYLSDSDFT